MPFADVPETVPTITVIHIKVHATRNVHLTGLGDIHLRARQQCGRLVDGQLAVSINIHRHVVGDGENVILRIEALSQSGNLQVVELCLTVDGVGHAIGRTVILSGHGAINNLEHAVVADEINRGARGATRCVQRRVGRIRATLIDGHRRFDVLDEVLVEEEDLVGIAEHAKRRRTASEVSNLEPLVRLAAVVYSYGA